MYKDVQFAQLLGLTLVSVEQGDYEGEDGVIFITDTGRKFIQTHRPGGCESVYIESIVGDLKDSVGSPILLAEESIDDKTPPPIHDEYTGDDGITKLIGGHVVNGNPVL